MMQTNKLQVVLDTNVLMVSFLPHHKHFWLYEALENGEFILLLSNEILEEYYEKIAERYNSSIADMLTFGLANLRHTRKISPSIRWLLIKDDPDDDKFTDCAIAGNADMIVSNDGHFRILKKTPYPIVKVVTLSEFKEIFEATKKMS
jgi:uncharacterized protein